MNPIIKVVSTITNSVKITGKEFITGRTVLGDDPTPNRSPIRQNKNTNYKNELAKAVPNKLVEEAIDILKQWLETEHRLNEIEKKERERKGQLEDRSKKIEKEIKRLESNDLLRKRLRKSLQELKKELDKTNMLRALGSFPNTLNKKYQEQEKTVKKVKPIVEEKSVREQLCPPLKSLTDDIFEIVKTITPVLIGLAATGVISVPVSPGLFVAGAAVVVSKMTVAAFCDDVTVEKAVRGIQTARGQKGQGTQSHTEKRGGSQRKSKI